MRMNLNNNYTVNNNSLSIGWYTTGNFVKRNTSSNPFGVNRMQEFKTIDEHISIRSITLYGYSDDICKIYITTRNPINVFDKIKTFAVYDSIISMYICENNDRFSDFLSVFYEEDLIPDLVIEMIVNNLEIDNFLINADLFIDNINAYIGSDGTNDYFEKTLFGELNKIKNQQRKEKMAFEIVSILEKRNYINPQLFIDLYKMVITTNTLIFEAANDRLTGLMLANNSNKNLCFNLRYEELIEFALKSGDSNKRQKNVIIQNYFRDDSVINIELPRELEDIDISNIDAAAKTVVRLLKLYKNAISNA